MRCGEGGRDRRCGEGGTGVGREGQEVWGVTGVGREGGTGGVGREGQEVWGGRDRCGERGRDRRCGEGGTGVGREGQVWGGRDRSGEGGTGVGREGQEVWGGREGQEVWGGRDRRCGEGQEVWGGRDRRCGEGGTGGVGREGQEVWGGREGQEVWGGRDRREQACPGLGMRLDAREENGGGVCQHEASQGDRRQTCPRLVPGGTSRCSARHAEDLIVTPFAQILASLRSVRNNYVTLTNAPSNKDGRNRRQSHGAGSNSTVHAPGSPSPTQHHETSQSTTDNIFSTPQELGRTAAVLGQPRGQSRQEGRKEAVEGVALWRRALPGQFSSSFNRRKSVVIIIQCNAIQYNAM
ncbi:hypothetical protein ACOMHN_009593 [Nucella lapillus]